MFILLAIKIVLNYKGRFSCKKTTKAAANFRSKVNTFLNLLQKKEQRI